MTVSFVNAALLTLGQGPLQGSVFPAIAEKPGDKEAEPQSKAQQQPVQGPFERRPIQQKDRRQQGSEEDQHQQQPQMGF